MRCWNCGKLISHKKVKWIQRKFALKVKPVLPIGIPFTDKNELEVVEDVETREELRAYTNNIFGCFEYGYRGQCPKCKAEQTLFWFGKDSIKRNKNAIIEKKPFYCHECKNQINRELQVWYGIRYREGDKTREFLVTLCPWCKTKQGYPFEYDLDHRFIE